MLNLMSESIGILLCNRCQNLSRIPLVCDTEFHVNYSNTWQLFDVEFDIGNYVNIIGSDAGCDSNITQCSESGTQCS